MDRLAHRAALTVVCAFLGLVGLLPATASATNNSYCGVLVSAGSWCGDGSDRYYVFNSVSYTGGGSVWVCERLLVYNSATQRDNPVCSYTYASASWPGFPTPSEAEVSHWTGANHTIYGLGSF
jgi:hypothetical protein